VSLHRPGHQEQRPLANCPIAPLIRYCARHLCCHCLCASGRSRVSAVVPAPSRRFSWTLCHPARDASGEIARHAGSSVNYGVIAAGSRVVCCAFLGGFHGNVTSSLSRDILAGLSEIRTKRLNRAEHCDCTYHSIDLADARAIMLSLIISKEERTRRPNNRHGLIVA